MFKTEDILKTVREIASQISSLGGTAYFVGGYVRDRILSRENKDIDIEVHGITINQLKSVLSQYGVVDEIGVSFGVLKIHGLDIDWSMPRLERKIGEGHKGFSIDVNPFCDVRTACSRRDFTINAIMMDVLTGTTVDPFNGLEDLKKGVIRCVDEKTFIEDPLRVFRAAQFASRFNFIIQDKTMELMKLIDTSSLPNERIYAEYQKMLLKASKPSIGIEVLRQLNLLPKNFIKMIGCEQPPQHHPEGDVWNHTMLVLDKAAEFKGSVEDAEILMWSALLHDIGKPASIEKHGHFHSHPEEGEVLSLEFLKTITNEKRLLEQVPVYVRYHMNPLFLFNSKAGKKSVVKLMSKVPNFNTLFILAKCDSLGRGVEEDFTPVEDYFSSIKQETGEKVPEAIVKGKDLLDLGLKPSPLFKQILDYAFDLQMDDMNKEDIIKKIETKYCTKQKENY